MGWPAVWTFIKAIFVGTKLTGAYLFAVNVARIALIAIIAKATAPKLDLSAVALNKTFTTRNPIAPQTFTYGADLVAGPLIFANVAGDLNRDLYLVTAFAGHEIDSIISYRIDDENINLGDLSGAYDGNVTGGKYSGVARVDTRLGTATQTAIANLTSTFGSLFNSAHRGRGWALMAWEFNLIEGMEEVFKTQPVNLRARFNGFKCYDPRLDSSVSGGSGSHDIDDDTTWEWTDNPALCLGHFIITHKFGMKEETDRINVDFMFIAADICDELVAIPTAATQKRYTCNVTFTATQRRRSVRDELVNSMLGRLVFSQGVWLMWAGAAVTSDVTLTEANLAGTISLQAGTASTERYNRVRGKYIDLAKDFTAASYPEQRSSAYVTEDNGEILPQVVDFMSTNNFYEAQRKAIYLLRQSRNQRVVVFEGNYSVFRVQPGATITLDLAEWGFAGEKFFVTEWKFNEQGISLTLVEEVDTVWDDPAEGNYTVRTATGALIFGETGVPAPTALTATPIADGILLNWTNPLFGTFSYMEVHRSDDNVRGNAVVIATVSASAFVDTVWENFRPKYYWVRAVNRHGEVSAFEPDLTTTTASAVPTSPGMALNPDPDFDLMTALGPDDFWDGEASDAGDFNTVDSSITYQSTGGSNGGARIEMVVGDRDGAGSNASVRLFSKRRFRSGGGAFTARIRYRRDDALSNRDEDWIVALVGYSVQTGGSPTGGGGPGGTVRFVDTGGDWTDIFISFQSTGVADTAQFWQIEFIFFDHAAPQGGYTVDLDSIYVFPASPAFGTNQSFGFISQGLVPQAQLTDVNQTPVDEGQHLNSSGSWSPATVGDTYTTWEFRTVTTGNPGSGRMRFNNATLASVTEIAMSDLSLDGVPDIGTFMQYIDDGNRLFISSPLDGTKSALFEATGVAVDQTGYWTVPVIHISSDTLPALNDSVNLYVSLSDSTTGGGAPVDSVFTRTGAVTALQADYDAFFLTPTEGNAAYEPLGVVDWEVTGAEDLHANRFGAGANMGDSFLDRPHIGDFAIDHQAITATTTTTINYSSGQSVALTMDAVISTLNLTNWPASGRLGQLQLEVIQGGTSRTINWPSVIWLSGSSPDMSTINTTYYIQLTSRDNGSTIYGSYAADSQDLVLSVFTRTGDVVAIQADYSAYFATIAHLHDGIADTDLLDKTAAETVSNLWQFTASINMQDSNIIRAQFDDFAILHQSVAGSGSPSINYSSGQSVLLTMSANSTLTTSNWPASGRLGQLQIEILQDTPARTITWPGVVNWLSGAPPNIGTDGETYFILLSSRDNGSTIQGSYASDSSSGVISVHTRTGDVVGIQADYDGFFLTPAEGNAFYEPIGVVDWEASGAEDIHSGRFGAGVSMADSALTRPFIDDFAILHQSVAGSGSPNLNHSSGQSVLLTMSANSTLTTSNWPASGRLGQFMIELLQDNPVRTVSWTGVTWLNGAAPDLTEADRTYFIQLTSRDAGSTIYGSYASDSASGVISVFGRSGAVVGILADYSAFFEQIDADILRADVADNITALHRFTYASEPAPSALQSTLTANFLHIDGKEAIDGNDNFMRLNQNAEFSSGVYTPGVLRSGGLFRTDGGLQTGSSTTTGLYVNSTETLLRWKGGGILRHAATSEGGGQITISTGNPSGGLAGDVWFKI